MKTLNGTLAGSFTGKPLPILKKRNSQSSVTATLWPGEPNRIRFDCPDVWIEGFDVTWDGKSNGGVFPPAPGMYEITPLMDPPFTGAFDYGASLPSLFPLKGATEMNLPAKMRAGEDIRPILQQRKRAGANCVRSLAMGYPFRSDQQPLTMAEAAQYWTICESEGLHVLWCVFAGTRTVMPELSRQLPYWEETKAAAASHRNVVLQLANEWNHGTQSIDPSKFSPSSANLCDHGPGLTDAHPVEPFWSLVTWHPRRDGTRGITNYDCYEFEAEPWPRAQPWIPGEGAKPEDYGFNPAYAHQMGAHGGINWGAVFHSNQGVRSDPWPASVEACARAFYEGVDRASA